MYEFLHLLQRDQMPRGPWFFALTRLVLSRFQDQEMGTPLLSWQSFSQVEALLSVP